MTMFGTYAPNQTGLVDQFAAWQGAPPDLASVHVGGASWGDFENSTDYCIRSNGWTRGDICLTLFLTVTGCPLSEVAAGTHNGSFLAAAQKALACLGHQSVIYVRVGPEFNLASTWPHSVPPGSPVDFAAAFRQLVGVWRGVSDKFRFHFNVNVGWADPYPSYPGREWVDGVSADWYANPGLWGEPTDPAANWAYMQSKLISLDWLAGFGKSQSLPIAIAEVGMNQNAFSPCLELFHDWIVKNVPLFVNWWNSDAAYQSRLDLNQFPTLGATYKRLFVPLSAGTAAPPVPVAAPPASTVVPVVALPVVALPVTSPSPAPATPSPSPAKGLPMHTLTIHVSGDSYQGPPALDVKVNATALPSVPVTAAHGAATQAVTVPLPSGVHVVTVGFSNDAYGSASPGQDRNLYVLGADLDGIDLAWGVTSFFVNGTKSFTVAVPFATADLDARFRALEVKAGVAPT